MDLPTTAEEAPSDLNGKHQPIFSSETFRKRKVFLFLEMQHHIQFSYEARYFMLGNTTAPSQIWFVLHGYGQLASAFIRKFNLLTDHGILLVAPEALSRFYLEETSERMRTGNNRVGASWMTREDRLTDIKNYLGLLNAVYQQIPATDATPVTILGFSQGAATATRWVLDGKVNFQRLILWAGILPPDIDFNVGKEMLSEKETILVYGEEDPYLTDSRFAEMTSLSEKLAITPRVVKFTGGHNIDTETLVKLI